jgi:MYXO-CTERM domain-containing protein
MKPIPILTAVALLSSGSASADLSIKTNGFTASVVEADVTYSIFACSTLTSGGTVGVFHDLSSPPGAGDSPDTSKGVNPAPPPDCTEVKLSWNGVAIGLYQSYARIEPLDASPGNNVAGPLEVCVGPDVVVKSFTVETVGATVTYKATVCNNGSMDAKKFRVGFWHDRSQAPASSEMGDIFKGIAVLKAGECKDIDVAAGLRPNGSFTAWSRADSGDFTEECREANNAFGPLPYALSNPDLVLDTFQAQVSGATVTYTVKVCNRGTAAVAKFFTDVYYNRTQQSPIIGEPGDEAQAVLQLAPSACKTLTFTRSSTPKGTYTSYAFADPDDYISEPNEANNLSMPLTVEVGKGSSTTTTGSCTDNDKDGAGTGSGCQGIPDCDDTDPSVNPKATESCDDQIDNDCDLTPNDGCPGVDCKDGDGDSFGVGKDCVLEDCDDSNKDHYPWAPEKCGDNKDDNCNKIADDGCKGRQCVDADMDGYGVGAGCPGPQDCDDADRSVNPGVPGEQGQTCGDGVDNDCDTVADDGCSTSVDGDGDGASVGGGATGQPDCNDRDPKIGPGQKETCGDKIDNDCDGTVDDGCPGVDCKDGDGDGWGVGKDCKIADCDDTDAAVHPWAKEVCGDGVDNDCDTTVDDGCDGVDCKDADLDGWGVGKDCKKPDCDDSDGGTSPWVKEICADGKDNNCDGAIDEDCIICQDNDGDGHGVGPKCTSWDCDDSDPDSYPGAPERCNNKDNDCDGEVDNDCSGGDDEGCSCGTGAGGSPSLPLVWLVLGLALLLAARRAGPRPG